MGPKDSGSPWGREQLDGLGGTFLPFSRMDTGTTQSSTQIPSFCSSGFHVRSGASSRATRKGSTEDSPPLRHPPPRPLKCPPGCWAPTPGQGLWMLPVFPLRAVSSDPAGERPPGRPLGTRAERDQECHTLLRRCAGVWLGSGDPSSSLQLALGPPLTC